MTVGELKKQLDKFDDNLEVVDIGYCGINYVEKEIIKDDYFHIEPDKEVVIIY